METRLESLNEYWATYNKHFDYLSNNYTEEELQSGGFDKDNNFDITEEAYMDLKTIIKDLAYEIQSTITTNTCENVTSDLPKIKPKLPPIPIPKFSGNYTDWISFRDLYLSLIHNDTTLSKIEKHHYLKSCLSGEAEQLLKNFTLTESNYDDAWKKLVERYNNKRIIVNNILHTMLNRKRCFQSLHKVLRNFWILLVSALIHLKTLISRSHIGTQ